MLIVILLEQLQIYNMSSPHFKRHLPCHITMTSEPPDMVAQPRMPIKSVLYHPVLVHFCIQHRCFLLLVMLHDSNELTGRLAWDVLHRACYISTQTQPTPPFWKNERQIVRVSLSEWSWVGCGVWGAWGTEILYGPQLDNVTHYQSCERGMQLHPPW